MADELTTKPTIETVLERISALDQKVDERMNALDQKVDERFESMDNEMDQLIRATHSTRADVVALRVHFKELRTQLKEVLPVPKAS